MMREGVAAAQQQRQRWGRSAVRAVRGNALTHHLDIEVGGVEQVACLPIMRCKELQPVCRPHPHPEAQAGAGAPSRSAPGNYLRWCARIRRGSLTR